MPKGWYVIEEDLPAWDDRGPLHHEKQHLPKFARRERGLNGIRGKTLVSGPSL